MTGVEILASEEVATAFGFCWIGFICLVFIGLIFGLLVYLAYENIPLSSFVFVFVLIIALIIGFNAKATPIKYETQYKVTISDEVSMNEFVERYEIIDQEGKIYTVRERE